MSAWLMTADVPLMTWLRWGQPDFSTVVPVPLRSPDSLLHTLRTLLTSYQSRSPAYTWAGELGSSSWKEGCQKLGGHMLKPPPN